GGGAVGVPGAFAEGQVRRGSRGGDHGVARRRRPDRGRRTPGRQGRRRDRGGAARRARPEREQDRRARRRSAGVAERRRAAARAREAGRRERVRARDREPVAARVRRRAITGVVLRLTLLSLLAALALPCAAHALTAAQGEAQLREIEARANALAKSPQPDRKALAELDRRAHALAEEASRALAALREDAAERDADMRAVVESREWQALEALLLKLRFRIAALQLERARAGDPDKERLARAAADGFGAFAEAADPTVAAEGRYGRGLARIVAGDRAGGIADLRAAAQVASVAPRARLALAE